MAKSRAAVGRIHHRADEVLRQEVIPRMSEDDVVRSIRYDLAIIICGNELCLRHRKEYRHKLIRANLRLCGRFLLFLQRKDPKITDFAAIYNPVYYHFIIKSIDEFAGINRRTGHYKTAGNATELTKHIKVIGELLKGEYIMSKEAEKKSNVDNFLTLCNTGFGNVINKTAMETLVARQRQRVVELPISNDILKISEYLGKVIDEHYNELKKGFSHLAWRKLSEAILSRMQVFNRRRAGESERLEITDMKSITAIKPDDEDYDTLTAEEKNSANEYMRVVIRGKLNSNVPIVLKKHWYSAIKLIVKYREQAGVSPENPYVFGIKGRSDQSFLVATKLLNMFSKECGAAKPALLRGTPLRKHAATKCAQLGLDDAKTAHFAKFMGHNINIHKDIYQQPVLKKDILGISKVLERAQKPSSTVTSGALENDASLNNQDSSLDKNNRTFESLPETENEPEETNSASMEISPSDDDENSTSQPRSSFGDQNYGYNHDTKKSPVVSRVPWTNEEIKNLKHCRLLQRFVIYKVNMVF
ncbi:uncharacterized protein LOC123269616 [Cotesia glomerata]|nr:uncharacterized protein LOC123269616 [Cotesia glomerata]